LSKMKSKNRNVERRALGVRLKTARGRRVSSTRWLQRQLNDPYVRAARESGYRSRAAFKLIELDERFGFLKNVRTAVDLGAAPGGWSQVLVSKLKPHSVIVAIDKADIDPIEGVLVIKKDIESQDTLTEILNITGSKVDLVLSDMAAASTGHARTDHIRVMALCEIAMVIAENILEQKGTFVAKVLKGGTERELLDRLKRSFGKVRHAKPPASRADSAEVYVVAQGFRES